MPRTDCPTETDPTVISRRYMVHERPVGNTAVLFGVLAIALVAIIGTTIDLSRLTFARQDLKHRLDAALIAGARESGSSRGAVAEDIFDAMPTGSIARTMTRHFEPATSGVSGTASAAVPTTFSSMLGIRSIRVTASGEAIIPDGPCENPAIARQNVARCSVTISSSTRTTPQS